MEAVTYPFVASLLWRWRQTVAEAPQGLGTVWLCLFQDILNFTVSNIVVIIYELYINLCVLFKINTKWNKSQSILQIILRTILHLPNFFNLPLHPYFCLFCVIHVKQHEKGGRVSGEREDLWDWVNRGEKD